MKIRIEYEIDDDQNGEWFDNIDDAKDYLDGIEEKTSKEIKVDYDNFLKKPSQVSQVSQQSKKTSLSEFIRKATPDYSHSRKLRISISTLGLLECVEEERVALKRANYECTYAGKTGETWEKKWKKIETKRNKDDLVI